MFAAIWDVMLCHLIEACMIRVGDFLLFKRNPLTASSGIRFSYSDDGGNRFL